MGWLFAVALGLQERRRSKVVWALGPIAVGHLASIAAVVAIIGGLRLFFAIDYASADRRRRADSCSGCFASRGRARIRAGLRCG